MPEETEIDKKPKNSQIKSRKRVVDHGEVFTNEREVNAMLDLVKDETVRIDSRFLEPACGDGNFLAPILERKLAVVDSQYGKSLDDYSKYSILALMSIYGVDIMEDNVGICRDRLYKIWEQAYLKKAKSKADETIKLTARYILSKNILCGNALSLKQVDESQKDKETPIIFAEWNFVSKDEVKRRDFRLDQLLSGYQGEPNVQLSLFEDDANSSQIDWNYDEETKAYIPHSIKEYPITDYRRLKDYE